MIPQFNDIRMAIEQMVLEARALSAGDVSNASGVWTEAVKYLDYVRELSDRQLAFIRVHTGFITGNAWFQYAHNPLRWAPDIDKGQSFLVKSYMDLTEDIPDQYKIGEPTPNPETKLVGLEWRGKLLTDDLIRYQRSIANLYNAGLLDVVPDRRKVVFEIGGGYGAMAHHISGVAPGTSYILVDLPEMLFWQAVYLRLNNPEKRIYIYTKETWRPDGLSDLAKDHDFILLPNYLIQDDLICPKFDIALNMLSFQEMTESQIRGYLSWLSQRLDGWLYSENFSRHVYNKELSGDLYDLLADYYNLIPGQRMSDHPDLKKNIWCLYAYLGTPTHAPAQLAPKKRELRSDYRITY